MNVLVAVWRATPVSWNYEMGIQFSTRYSRIACTVFSPPLLLFFVTALHKSVLQFPSLWNCPQRGQYNYNSI